MRQFSFCRAPGINEKWILRHTSKKVYWKALKASGHSDVSSFRSVGAQLAWAENSSLEVSCAVAIICQGTDKIINCDHTAKRKQINFVLSHLKNYSDIKLPNPKLDKNSHVFKIYVDASFATKYDKYFQHRYIIFIIDKSEECHSLHWISYTSKRSTNLVLESQVMTCAVAFDMLFMLKNNFERMTSTKVFLYIMTNCILYSICWRKMFLQQKNVWQLTCRQQKCISFVWI